MAGLSPDLEEKLQELEKELEVRHWENLSDSSSLKSTITDAPSPIQEGDITEKGYDTSRPTSTCAGSLVAPLLRLCATANLGLYSRQIPEEEDTAPLGLRCKRCITASIRPPNTLRRQFHPSFERWAHCGEPRGSQCECLTDGFGDPLLPCDHKSVNGRLPPRVFLCTTRPGRTPGPWRPHG